VNLRNYCSFRTTNTLSCHSWRRGKFVSCAVCIINLSIAACQTQAQDH
jgi:hypothetical protein